MPNRINLKSFLKFGYFIDYKNTKVFFDIENIDRKKYIHYSEKELIDLGHSLFLEAVQRNFNTNTEQFVPLSGGLDSRFILSALLEFTDASSITTITYGSPGTFDFELGNKTAKKTGTNHLSIPLNNLKYDSDEILETARKFDLQTSLFFHPPLKILNNYVQNGDVWSGFMGDPGAGSKLKLPYSETLEQASDFFISKNNFCSTSKRISISPDEIIPFMDRSDTKSEISIDEELDFYNRQLKYIAPHVLYKGANFKTPFTDNEYFNFILSLPDEYRQNQALFKKILIQKYPEEFSVPVKNNFGRSLSASDSDIKISKLYYKLKSIILGGIDPMTNYVDFSKELKTNSSLKDIVFQSVNDLKTRKIIDEIVDIDVILDEYHKSKNDHSIFLLLLASLELNLKAGLTTKKGKI